ncbi:hypothetical protein PIB30_049509 [Stylosanthes scabra]|uniref:Uncharacterized protein n=1 Tax=Stylosanthes scabra TaxID=79078 RepID=A0ABU6THR2_9FABA|nr:hypothetical protein [Stylosanthes scabra]
MFKSSCVLLGKPFDEKFIPKDLNEEDYAAHKFFQGKTRAALSKLIMDTPLDTYENKRLFMRAFVLFTQKCFLLATSSANVTPRALPTIFDVENTKERNWALHVHNFLLEEVKKAKLNNTKAIHGCCYAMLIIYFQETQFEKNAKEHQLQPPWIRYWNGDTLRERMKQEKRHAAKKNPKKKASSEYESEAEYEESSSDESDLKSYSEETRSAKLIQKKQNTKPNPVQEETRSKKKARIEYNRGIK